MAAENVNSIVGTESDDTIEGTDQKDEIRSLGGNDVISAHGGDDYIDAVQGIMSFMPLLETMRFIQAEVMTLFGVILGNPSRLRPRQKA